MGHMRISDIGPSSVILNQTIFYENLKTYSDNIGRWSLFEEVSYVIWVILVNCTLQSVISL